MGFGGDNLGGIADNAYFLGYLIDIGNEALVLIDGNREDFFELLGNYFFLGRTSVADFINVFVIGDGDFS